MKRITLSEKDMEYVKSFVKNDIIEAASNLSFFYEMKLEPKDFIDQMSALAKMLGMDFWEIIGRNCSDVELNRLNDLYEGNFSSKIIADILPNIKITGKTGNERFRQNISLVAI